MGDFKWGILNDFDFNNIRLLQYSMLLLGGFHQKCIPREDINEARIALKKYV